MANTPRTPASVASRLTDEEILEEAAWTSRMGHRGIAAVMRDYVRLRKLANAVKAKVNYAFYHGEVYTTQDAITELHRLLAEAEKGEAK